MAVNSDESSTCKDYQEEEEEAAAPDLHEAQQVKDRFSPFWLCRPPPPKRSWASSKSFLFWVILAIGASIFWVAFSSFSSSISVIIGGSNLNVEELPSSGTKTTPIEFSLNCSDVPESCKANNTSATHRAQGLSATACPEYFRWIYEDLRPWNATGITRDTLESAKQYAHFRLAIIKGKAYLEKYYNAYQTRDLFTIWGIVQLLKMYPGMVPDLELMFRCEDRPIIEKKDYQGPNASSPPVLFQYCAHDGNWAVVFPDWSFWGWIETNIRPWSGIREAIIEASNLTKWEDRIPYAFWKGSPLSPDRRDLFKCNPTLFYDWDVRVYKQDWGNEVEGGFKHSNLEDQCAHRYKIYIEGWGWSVSEKYILACDSMTLLIEPEFNDFFSRGLVPLQHYWPVRRTKKCKDIKFAVNWGNRHPEKVQAQAIGKGGSRYTQEDLKMENVYAYMLHLLTEYAKLQKFEPRIPVGAIELCSERMACSENGVPRNFMAESMVKSPSEAPPCNMPPYDASALQAFLDRKDNITRQVEMWANKNRVH